MNNLSAITSLVVTISLVLATVSPVPSHQILPVGDREPQAVGRGKLLDSYVATGTSFKIRIREFDETDTVVLPKYYLTIEYAQRGSDRWKELAADRTDERVEIPTGQIKFIGSEIGYAYLWRVFASTTDAGHTWAVWDARQDTPGWQCCHQAFIRQLQISDDGQGTMLLQPKFHGVPPGVLPPELRTGDYGQHWHSSSTTR